MTDTLEKCIAEIEKRVDEHERTASKGYDAGYDMAHVDGLNEAIQALKELLPTKNLLK